MAAAQLGIKDLFVCHGLDLRPQQHLDLDLTILISLLINLLINSLVIDGPHPFVHTPGPLPRVRCISGRHLDLDLTCLIS